GGRGAREARPLALRINTVISSGIAASRTSGQFGWPFEGAAELTTPSATNRNGSIFLMSRTPLLCEEGNVRAEKLCPKKLKLQPCYTKGLAVERPSQCLSPIPRGV